MSASIFCATPSAVIRYTLDGSVPAVTSPVFYTNLMFTNLTMLRARAFKDGMTPSGTVFAYYVEPPTRTDMGYYRSVTNDPGQLQPLVSVTIAGASNVTCFTIEERLPAPVTPVNIDSGGQWLPALGVVRWGPYTNVPTVTVSYRISGMPGFYSVGGVAWADGRWKFEPPDSTATILGGPDVSVPTAPVQVAAPVITTLASQAELASFGGGVTINATNAGFKGTGFASFPLTGGFLQFNGVNGGLGGAGTLSVRFALGAGSSRTGRLIVNGVTNSITFSPTGTWTNWTSQTNRITLNTGVANTIRFESSGSGLANLDEITVSGDNPAAPVDVVITCATTGATIYYTLDGTLPTTTSQLYTGPLSLTDAAVVRARAFQSGFQPSAAVVANFAAPPTIGTAVSSRSVLTNVAWTPVMNIAFTPGTGAVCQAFEETVPGELMISNVSGGGVSSSGVVRWGPFFGTNGQTFSYQATGLAGNYAVNGRWSRDGQGVDMGGTNLVVGNTTNTLVIPVQPSKLPAPAMVPALSATLPVSVVITDAIAGVEIRYTTDGTTPQTNSPLYSSGLNLTSLTSLRARAFLSGWLSSDAALGYYGALTNDAGTSVDIARTIPANTNAAPQITLTTAPHGGVRCYTVTETVPLGLTPSNLTQNAVWNPTDRTLKWGPFTNQTVVMNYQVAGIAGAFACEGQGSVDGYPWAVTGQSNLVVTSTADTTTPAQPLKLPTPRLTPANTSALPVTVTATCSVGTAQLRYTLDGTVPTINSALYASPLQFTADTTLRLRAFQSGWTASDAVVGYYQPAASATGLIVTRGITNSPGYAPWVKLTATPVGNVSSYTVTESVPYGITPFNVAPLGLWSVSDRTLKWGPFTNEIRALSYQVSGLSGTNVLDGAGSVDGFAAAIRGITNVVIDLSLMPNPAAPAITVQPLSQPAAVGVDLVLYADAVGAPPPSYQWRKDGTNLFGATSQALVRANFQPADVGEYDVIVANTAGAVTSQVAVVTMIMAPAIVAQPQSVTTNTGAAVTFSVMASGSTPLSYFWRRNSTPIAGAAGTSYTINNVQLADSGAQFSCLVSNGNGTIISSNAVLTVFAPPAITAQPQSVTTNAGATVTFRVTASGSGPLSYFWRRNGTPIAGATGTSYTINNVQLADSGAQFSCLVSN
ncbi:MAG: chitobiase/beta-hexosaminidase C-terminal domain-containing protein, partial [Verrucomicrobiota bacterium]